MSFELRPSLSRLLAFLLFLTGILANPLITLDARAADPPKITVKSGGPDRPYPLGQEFTVEAESASKTLLQVDLVFVRTAHKVFGLGDPTEKSCQQVQTAIEKAPLLDTAPTGSTTLGALWKLEDPLDSLSAYRVTPWKQTAGKEEKFSLTVPASDFFRAGATYCAFLFYKDTPPLVTKELFAAVTEFVDAWQSCIALPTREAEESACGAAATKYDEARTKFFDGAHLSAEDKKKIEGQLNDLENALSSARRGRGYAEALTRSDTWPRVFKPRPDREPAQVPKELDVATNPIAKLTLALLAVHGDVVVVYPAQKQTGTSSTTDGPQYFAAGGSAPITHVDFDGDLNEIRLYTDITSASGVKKAATKADGLNFPGVDDVTLRDVLELSRQRFRFETGKYLSMEKGYDGYLKPSLQADLSALDSAKLEKSIGAFRTRLSRLDEVVAAAMRAQPAAAQPDASPAGSVAVLRPIPTLLRWDAVYQPLGKWLLDAILQPCDKDLASALGKAMGGTKVTCVDKKGPPWPGFAPEKQDPFGILASQLDGILRNVATAVDSKAALEKMQQQPSTKLVSSVATASELSRETWFAQYVVTTVGIATVQNTAEPFFVNYYGFKVYPWANRVDEPKSILNSGWHRLLSVELALVPNLNTFGPSKRFQGLAQGAVPPLMLGVAFQPFPYVTVSTGAIFMESRRSVLDKETASPFISPYFAVALDLNILDVAAAALDRGRTTTLSKLVKQ